MPNQNRLDKGQFFIFHTVDMQEAHAIASANSKWDELVAFINEPRYTVKAATASYRTINHWSEQGLLEDRRESTESGWRKLSFKDVLWLRVLSELRAFGLPLTALKKTFDDLFYIRGKRSDKKLELAIALCQPPKPQPVFLVVFQDGMAEIASLVDLRATDELVGYQHPYIRLNLNTLLCEAFDTKEFMPKQSEPKAKGKK